MRRLGVFTLALGLQACARAEEPMVMIMTEISACDVAALEGYLGWKREAFSGVRFTVPVRWIPEGGMITMDYSAERINFEIDDTDVITRVFCG